jgi:hypothetical protein
MRLRTVYLILTSLSVLWVYLFVLYWRKHWVEALLAASFLAFSWEVAYHLRWVATDGMLMQFGALTLLFVGLSQLRPNGQKWLWCAAITAGLGCGTKYPGGLLVIPVILGGYFVRNPGSFNYFRFGLLMKIGLLFGVTYLITTPGTLLQPTAFIKGIFYEMEHYSTGHGGHTINPGWEHAWRMFTYFAWVLFSSFPPVAFVIFLFFTVGCYTVIKKSPRIALVILSFPVIYILFFITQSAMVVRNLLVIAPFMAVLAARGAGFLWKKISEVPPWHLNRKFMLNPIKVGFGAFIVVSITANAGWLIYAAETIVDRNTNRFAREAVAYIKANTDGNFFLSPLVQIHLSVIDSPQISNLTNDLSQAKDIVLYASEGTRRWHDWPANRPWLTKKWFGPREVNLNMYPNWWGDDRILIISVSKARENDIFAAFNHINPHLHAQSVFHPANSNTRAKEHLTSWALPAIDPCTLVSMGNTESLIGPLKDITRGWILDGTACIYIGELPTMIMLGVISTAAFEIQKSEPGTKTIADIGDYAFTSKSNAFKDVRLFVRYDKVAFVIKVAGLEGKQQPSNLKLAKKFARYVMDPLMR